MPRDRQKWKQRSSAGVMVPVTSLHSQLLLHHSPQPISIEPTHLAAHHLPKMFGYVKSGDMSLMDPNLPSKYRFRRTLLLQRAAAPEPEPPTSKLLRYALSTTNNPQSHPPTPKSPNSTPAPPKSPGKTPQLMYGSTPAVEPSRSSRPWTSIKTAIHCTQRVSSSLIKIMDGCCVGSRSGRGWTSVRSRISCRRRRGS